MSLLLSLSSNMPATTPPTAPPFFSCPLCCEDKPSSDLCILTKCSHESCKECCVKWIEKAETSGQHTLPACPWCRLPMTEEETMKFLGRPFTPATANNNNTTTTLQQQAELDEFTLAWLNEQTKPCPSCGAQIEKLEGGCDLMECLCGYRFCYGCGSPNAQCRCTPAHHYFWDNVLDRAAPRQALPTCTLVDSDGHIDLKHHLEQRWQNQRAEQTRQERQNRRNQCFREQREWESDLPTSSAIWMFGSRTNQGGLRILNQIVQKSKLRATRGRLNYNRMVERQQLDGGLFGAKWLYDCKGAGWKYLKYITSQNGLDIQRRRHRRRITVMREEINLHNDITRHGHWLFDAKTNQASLQILAAQVSTAANVVKRTRMNRRAEVTEFTGAMVPITNGVWLFSKQTNAKTIRRLERLFQHQDRLSRGVTRTLHSLRSRIVCGRGSAAASNASRMANDEAAYNAMTIRLLFRNEEERAKERAEIASRGL